MEHLATFPEDKRPVNGQEKTLRMLVVSWGKAKPIMWPTQREYDARKRMRNERLAKYRANDESTRYALGRVLLLSYSADNPEIFVQIYA